MKPLRNQNDDLEMGRGKGSLGENVNLQESQLGVEGQISRLISEEIRDNVTGPDKRLDSLQPKQTPMKIFQVPALTALENVKRDNINEYQTSLAFSLMNGQDESTLFSMSSMPKSTLMQILTKEFPHNRPQTVSCAYQTLTEAISGLGASEVYIKGNTAGAEDVYHVILLDDDTCRVISRDYSEIVVPVSILGDELKRLKGGANNSDELLVEEAMNIPQTSERSTWEVRFYPSIKKELTRPSAWMKVSQPNSSFNIVDQKGTKMLFLGQYEATLDEIIGNCLEETDDKEAFVVAERKRFLDEAEELADSVRLFLGQEHQSAIREYIQPSGLKDPKSYEKMLQECFCTIVSDVDITGTWDAEKRKLKPMIMEVHEEFSVEDLVREILVTGLKDVGVPYRYNRLCEYLTPEASERLLYTAFEQAPSAFEKDFADCFNSAGAIHWTRSDNREIWRSEVALQMSVFFYNHREFLNAQPDIANVIRTSFLKALIGDMEIIADADGTATRKPIDFNDSSLQKGLSELFGVTAESFQDQPESLRGDLCMAVRKAKLKQTIPDLRICEVIEKASILQQGIASLRGDS